MEYEYLPYRPEFRDGVLRLQRVLWSRNLNVNSEHLKWKYEENPYLPDVLIYVALYDGQVVGMRGIYGTKWEFGDPSNSQVIVCGGDTVVEPEHQSRGLFRRIDSAAIDGLVALGYEYVFNLSAAPVTFLRSLRAGWNALGPYNIYAWDGRKHQERRSAPKRDYPNVTGTREVRAAEMASLAGKNGPNGKIRHVKDRQYYEWRFQNPLSRFGFLYWDEGGELQGYLVIQTPRLRKTRFINIVDWEVARPEIYDELINNAVDRWHSNLVTTWTSTLAPSQMSLLRSLGFEYWDETHGVKKYEPGLLIKAVGSDAPAEEWSIGGTKLLDMSNWDLRMLFSDFA